MKTKKLLELLSLVGEVKSNRWNTVRDVVECLKTKTDTDIIKAYWNDTWKQENPKYNPLVLSEIKTWSTYEGDCIDLRFSNKNEKLHCSAKIYDGRLLDGKMQKIRFTAEFILPTSFIDNLESSITWAFESYLEHEYENYLEMQRKNWIEKLKTKIINTD